MRSRAVSAQPLSSTPRLPAGVGGFRLVIRGVAISSMLAAVNYWLILRAELSEAMSAAQWGGNPETITWQLTTPALCVIIVLVVGVAALSRRHPVFELGPVRQDLGAQSRASQLGLPILGVALTAAATAVAGPIAFISVRTAYRPQARRRRRTPLTVTALLGSLLLVVMMSLPHAPFAAGTTGGRDHGMPRRHLPLLPSVPRDEAGTMTAISTRLGADGLTLGYGEKAIARDLTVEIPDNKFTVIIGPNASEVDAAAGVVAAARPPLRARSSSTENRSKSTRPRRSRRFWGCCRRPRSRRRHPGRRTRVAGRYPHQQFLRQWSQEDEDAVARGDGGHRCGAHLAGERVDRLSGGQRQRVWVALVLAQDPAGIARRADDLPGHRLSGGAARPCADGCSVRRTGRWWPYCTTSIRPAVTPTTSSRCAPVR